MNSYNIMIDNNRRNEKKNSNEHDYHLSDHLRKTVYSLIKLNTDYKPYTLSLYLSK